MVVTHLRIRPPGPISRALRAVSRYLPQLNFITLHYLYFVATCLIGSLIIWGSSTPFRSLSYVNALFLSVSAMTLAGLNTVNLSTLNTFQQFMLFALTLLGSAILVSAVVVSVRKKAFEAKLRHTVHAQFRKTKAQATSRALPDGALAISSPGSSGPGNAQLQQDTLRDRIPFEWTETRARGRPSEDAEKQHNALHSLHSSQSGPDSEASELPRYEFHDRPPGTGITFASDAESRDSLSKYNEAGKRRHSRMFSMQGVGADPNAAVLHHYGRASGGHRPSCNRASATSERRPSGDTLSMASGFIGRNSRFFDLSPSDREVLGGVEYRALKLLAWLVPAYFILWQLLACLGLGAWIARNKADVARANGLNPWWVGAFNAVSAFNNNGMSLLDMNMIPFQQSYYVLITMGLLILAGNTCYPLFLRLFIWIIYTATPNTPSFAERKETLQFMLNHPRRCYTNLFPARHTWWLLCAVVTLTGIDWVAFEILNIGNPTIESLPHGARVMDGLFQAIAVRSGGFYIVNISSLRVDLLVLYVIMMYISVYPVVITMRNSNVYEERSLGLYADDPVIQEPANNSGRWGSILGGLRRQMTRTDTGETKGYFVRQQLRAQLAHDLWWVVLAVFLITIVESGSYERNPVTYSVFNIMFEVVSAYGCVGISTGLPDQNYSFVGGWHTVSKLILCAVMIRGRHRGLPVAIDRAVLLPGEHLAEAEEEDAQIDLMGRPNSRRGIV
ncbi:hypothetical protein L228DRAFT_143655 [Xylona heveae TC161]|uniref:Potassium transport protein n=1 Tax=Xylona heveae (strain CBS 132557 / TC161) TaxID=1328760 RepID=A0A165GAK9_XYLHT|nr:hypothetical protein L228DRAFT_143655 [Xylona heveae TC161]KZF21951.1 hypothetical protein L228DRAFT_143655 [Xylona heveae TC161]